MAYTHIKRVFDHSEWISGSPELLSSCQELKGIDGAKWIWPSCYTRAHIRRYFDCPANATATAHFICDNIFDLYINGELVSFENREFFGDISKYLKEGRNLIAIRGYQSDDVSYFTSAICGAIHFGQTSLVTDGTWESYVAVGFWENTEPDNWAELNPGYNSTQVCEIHPRAYRHSLLFKRELEIAEGIKSAKVYVTEDGTAEFYVNGERTDDEVLSQGVCRTVREYRVIDITSMLKEGKNVIGAITGSAWLNSESHSQMRMLKNRLLCEIELEYANGKREIIGTDGTWLCAASPLTDNDLQFGERYDATREIDAWCEVGCTGGAWYPACCDGADNGERDIIERNYPPIRITRRVKPVSAWEKDGKLFYDMGENCAGSFCLKLKNAERGTQVIVSFCERLDENGDFSLGVYVPVFMNRDALPDGKARGSLRNTNTYICRGGESETFEPHFTFSGFRYLCVEGISKENIESIEMTVMHNDLRDTGVLKSDYKFIEQLFDATFRSWKSNLMNGPMDCPTREKNYWTGDSQLFTPTACYLQDCREILERWSDCGRKMCPGVYGWGDEIYVIPYALYCFYGDINLLKCRYNDILDYVNGRMENLENGLPVKVNSPFNDHLSPERKNVPANFFAYSFYCYMLREVAKIAAILGDTETEQRLKAALIPAKAEFNRLFLNESGDNYSPNNQSGIVLPLAFDIAPEDKRETLAATLDRMIRETGSLNTGYIGTRFLMEVLCDYGYKDTAFLLLDREEFPSWKNMLANTPKTISETWTGEPDRSDENSISMNHFTLGAVIGWLFKYVAGIRYDESAPGFSSLALHPFIIEQLGGLEAELDTDHGKISVSWRAKDGVTEYSFDTPVPTVLVRPDGSKESFTAGKHTVTL